MSNSNAQTSRHPDQPTSYSRLRRRMQSQTEGNTKTNLLHPMIECEQDDFILDSNDDIYSDCFENLGGSPAAASDSAGGMVIGMLKDVDHPAEFIPTWYGRGPHCTPRLTTPESRLATLQGLGRGLAIKARRHEAHEYAIRQMARSLHLESWVKHSIDGHFNRWFLKSPKWPTQCGKLGLCAKKCVCCGSCQATRLLHTIFERLLARSE
ncbi:hypothetical protein DFH27DRAFT_644948 [Peziza echinospora]|nr:hypothetical protein DFH27DRAFT_644948 [Peziza echinospora]